GRAPLRVHPNGCGRPRVTRSARAPRGRGMSAAFRVEPWSIQDVCVFTPEPFRDHRGFFVRTLSTATLAAAGIDPGSFVEESQSRSRHGVTRGLHGRRALSEGKLVRCSYGQVHEVIVDLRPWSTTFLQ